MEYVLPKDIHKSLNVSLKTVYNYINRHPDKIRKKKENGKVFVHFEDITKLVQSLQNPYISEQKIDNKNGVGKKIESVKNEDSKLQNLYKDVKYENTTLLKRNDTLERQVKEYGELFLSEKTEKKERIDKYEVVQNLTNSTLKKYYLSLALSIFLVLVLGVVILITYLGFSFTS